MPSRSLGFYCTPILGFVKFTPGSRDVEMEAESLIVREEQPALVRLMTA